MAVAGLVLGIVSLVCGWIGIAVPFLPFGTLVLAIIGLILSVVAGKSNKSGVATAGLVVGIISIVVNGIITVSCTICVSLLGAADCLANESQAVISLFL